MAGEQLFSKFVIKGGGKTFTEQSTILIFRQKPIRLIVVNAAVIETYTVKKCTNRSRCAHGIYSLTMILKKNAKYRLFDFIQVKAKAGNTGIGIGLCHRKHLIHYGSESPCRIQNNSLNNFAKVICVFRVTHHEIVDGAVLQTELLRVCLDDFQNVLFLEIILGMQTGKLFVRDRNARAIFCIGFFAAQHPVKDVLSCTENRLIVHHIGDNGSLTMKKMRIYSANNVFIEVTRRCNMCCAHCLRGDAESIDIQEKYIDAFLDNFEKGAYISSLTFTGGEISLNIPAIRYTLKAVKERGIAVGSFYMVTNGKAVDKMADLAMASLEWWAYCDEKDDYMCGLCISSDNFHEVIPYESKSILSGLKYNRNDKVTDFHLAYLLNEGRAKNLDSNIYKKREPHVDKLEYEFNKTGDIDFYSGELYLNAIGDVVSGCDWSYKSQKKYRFGNVMNKNWLENISNSELYIAS